MAKELGLTLQGLIELSDYELSIWISYFNFKQVMEKHHREAQRSKMNAPKRRR